MLYTYHLYCNVCEVNRVLCFWLDFEKKKKEEACTSSVNSVILKHFRSVSAVLFFPPTAMYEGIQYRGQSMTKHTNGTGSQF